VVAVCGNALMFAIGFAVALRPFIGAAAKTPKAAHEGPLSLWLGPVVLGAAGLAAALVSPITHRFFSSPTASAVAGNPVDVTISTIPHLGVPLLLSALTVALGIAAYLCLDRLRGAMAGILKAIGWGPDQGFDQLLRGLLRFAAGLTRIVHNGRLDIYMTVTFMAVAAALLLPMVLFGELPSMPDVPALRFYEWGVLAIAVIGIAAVVKARSRLTAIVSLGIQGFAVALLYMLFGAPDLSFTQFMVETLSVVILALVMTRLRLAPTDRRPHAQKLLDMAIAAACGTAFALLLLKVTQTAVRRPAVAVLQHLRQDHRPWPQCGERHHRRFPRPRHAGRNRRGDGDGPRHPCADTHPLEKGGRSCPGQEGGVTCRR
jgi:multicomponent Na+:H+ antiporter subunit A